MKWVSMVSDDPELESAAARGIVELQRQLDGQRPDLVLVFVSPHHEEHFERLPGWISAELGGGLLLGCSAGGVIGDGREVERRPGLSLTAAVLPGVELQGLRVEPSGAASVPLGWKDSGAGGKPCFLLFPDPFSFDAESFVRAVDAAFPRSTTIGGLASGGEGPGQNALILGERVFRDGLVGLALRGNVEIDSIVAQGCRPIGQPMFVTLHEGSAIHELDGRPALEALRAVHRELSAEDQALFPHSLFLGVAMVGQREQYRQGDFLIRNLVGVEPQSQALVVAATLEDNQVVQFHLRDAGTSARDLEQLLEAYRNDGAASRARGAVLFSCLGRGLHLYGRPDHDTAAFAAALGSVPLGGFFCNGEIGPVQGTTFLHGYTSAFGVFRPRDE